MDIMDGKSDVAAAKKVAAAASVEEGNVNETQWIKGKRSIKVTHKTLAERLEKLQNFKKRQVK